MRKWLYIIIVVVVFIVVAIFVYQWESTIQLNKEIESRRLKEASYVPKLEVVLESKMKELSRLMLEPDILSYIIQANTQYENVEAEKLLDIDAYWETAPDDNPLLELFTTNKAAQRIKAFRLSSEVFIEIFITGKHGFNVAQTSRTSDIYQADEQWWKKTYGGGEGESFIGAIQFDSDFLIAGIPIHIPVINPSTNEVIGVAKGIISIDAIKSEL